jgi:O-methyltransferase
MLNRAGCRVIRNAPEISRCAAARRLAVCCAVVENRGKTMSLLNHAKQTRRVLTNAFKNNYGRRMPYSAFVDKVNRQPLLDNFKQRYADVPAFATREEMWSFIADRHAGAVDYLEFGVHRGHSILYFAKQNTSPESRFFGFDCFTGLPEDWDSDYPRGHFDTGGRIPQTTDARVQFVVGMFQDTLPEFVAKFTPRNRIVVNIDCDLYSSALYCLTKLDAILPNGSILMFDEFGSVLHEFRAVQDYLSSYRREFNVLCSHDNFFTIAGELS